MKIFKQSPTDSDFVQNPYPFYDRTRAQGPLFFWEDYELPCLTGHSEVVAALKDRRMGREVPAELAPDIPDRLKAFYDIEAHSMLELEPPRHTNLRKLVLHAFTSRRIKALEPEIESLCTELQDRFPDGPFDLMTHYAQPLPVIVIARLLGVPEDDRDDLLRWSNAMVAMYMANRSQEVEEKAMAASKAFSAYISDHIAHKARHPADDLISKLIEAEQDGEKLTRDELITTCILLLNAGHEATVHSLGNATKLLLEQNHRTINEGTVEEALRLDPPLHMFTRWVYEPLEIAGHTFNRGDQIACLLGAANRDERAYPDPNQFDPTRQKPMNTSFGAGIHFCVGAPLARLELLIGLRSMFNRYPNLTLAEQPEYSDIYHFHGLKSLMLKR